MIFEVQIPAVDGSGRQSTFQIQASSWRSALNAGLQQSGEGELDLAGASVEIQDDMVIVTDPTNRRMLHVRQIDEADAQASKLIMSMTGKFKPVKAPEDPSSGGRMRVATGENKAAIGKAPSGIGFTDKNTGQFRAIGTSEIKRADSDSVVLQEIHAPAPSPAPPAAAPPAAAPPVAAAPVKAPVAEKPSKKNKKRKQKAGAAAAPAAPAVEAPAAEAPAPAPAPAAAAPEGAVSETALEDVFLDIMTIFEPGYALEDAIDFVIDLAVKYIPSASGGVMFASDTADHLYFAAARGEGRKKLLKHEFSIDLGIPARSLQNGVAVALSEPNSDPRHTSQITDFTGIDVNSIACAPIQHSERAYGVMLLVNRQERGFFSQYDSNILSYIGGQMGKFIQEQLAAQPLE
ncbi:MAG: hypothetical protein ACJA1R_000923 [Flavobacteriales bacterium]|jgi:hypothetical protein